MIYKMDEYKATFELQKELREEKIKREYFEKKLVQQEQRKRVKSDKKAKKKNK